MYCYLPSQTDPSPECKCTVFHNVDGNASLGSSRAEIEFQIHRIEECIESLFHQKAILKQRLNSLSLISEMFPEEVISEIFIWACELGYSSPIILGNVCRAWRRISESTPCLWRSLRFTPQQMGSPNGLDFLLKWIQLGKEYPRTFQTPAVYWDDISAFRKLLGALASSSSSWRNISSSDSSGLNLFVNHKLDFGNLETLDVNFGTSDDKIIIHELENAPRLREVRLWSSRLPLLEAVKLSWAQIDSFAASLRPVSEFLHIFKSTPMLRRCFLKFVCQDDAIGTEKMDDLSISMPSLQLLQLRNAYLDTCFFLLSKISAPKLEAISFFRCTSLSCNSYSSPLSPWKSTLRRLEISDCDVTQNDIIALLESTTYLIELRLIPRKQITDDLITRFVYTSEFCSEFLPHLQILELKELVGDPSLVVRMLEGRKSYSCLKYADISMKYSSYGDFEDAKKRIQDLGGQMKLSLSIYGDSWINSISNNFWRSAWWDIDLFETQVCNRC